MTTLILEDHELHRVPTTEDEPVHQASPDCFCDPVEVMNPGRPPLWLHRRQNQL